MIKDNFALRLYTRVARLGSFSAAARECGLSQSQASRIVAELEAEIGVRLLTRTTRAVTPTEAGGAGTSSRMPWMSRYGSVDYPTRPPPRSSSPRFPGSSWPLRSTRRATAAAGFGITSTSGWACRRELESGVLTRVLQDWSLVGIAVHAYFPMGRATRVAARAVIDHLTATFQSEPPAEST